jgi:hypothetical protein
MPRSSYNLDDLQFHWGDVYTLRKARGRYTAEAKFGDHDLLAADSPDELAAKLRRHYPGTRADLSST